MLNTHSQWARHRWRNKRSGAILSNFFYSVSHSYYTSDDGIIQNMPDLRPQYLLYVFVYHTGCMEAPLQTSSVFDGGLSISYAASSTREISAKMLVIMLLLLKISSTSPQMHMLCQQLWPPFKGPLNDVLPSGTFFPPGSSDLGFSFSEGPYCY